MAADKKTFIRNAQKQVQKGQIDRAITTYKAILKLDPNDVKVHNTLGDLHIRKNQKKEGIGEYLWVADYYEKDGFLLRSIAICQKILNLDSEMIEVRLKLADLYTQQKLAAEAKKQYLLVADHYEKKGMVAEALESFSKLADLDPGNLQIRIRLGSSYEKQGFPNKAAREYARVAEGLIKAGSVEKAEELLGKALEISPDSAESRRVKAELHGSQEEWDKAAETLRPLTSAADADVQILKTYAGACLKTHQAAEAITALEKAREAEPSSFPLKTLLGQAYIAGSLFDKARALYGPLIEEFLKEDKVEAAEDLARQLADADPSSEEGLRQLVAVVEKSGNKDEAANAHTRLAALLETGGDSAGATASLEKVLELRPDDAAAAEMLQRLKGAEAGPAQEDAETAAPPEEAEAAPAPPAETEAPEMPPTDLADGFPEGVALDSGSAEEMVLDDDEIEISLEDDEEELVAFAEAAAEAELEEPAADLPPDAVEGPALELDEPMPEESPVGLAADLPAEDVETLDLEGGDEDDGMGTVDLSTVVGEELADLGETVSSAAEEEEPVEEAVTVEETAAVDAFTGAGDGADEAFEVDLEDFDGLDAEGPDEADLFSTDEVSELVEEGILDDGASGEGGGVPEQEVTGQVEAPAEGDRGDLDQAAGSAVDIDAGSLADLDDLDVGGGMEEAAEAVGIDTDELEKVDAVSEAPADSVSVSSENEELEEFLAEADFYMQQGLTDEAEFLYQKLVKLAPDNVEIAKRLAKLQGGKGGEAVEGSEEPVIAREEIAALESDLDRVLGTSKEEPAPPAGPLDEAARKLTVSDGEGAGDTSEFSDFLTDLKGEFEEEEVREPAPVAADEQSLSEIFQEFQEGLREQLGEEDFETHYNLGIAYKEMGLMQEALGEFGLSEKSEARRMDSISMIALCQRELGSIDEAVAKLREGLSLAVEGSEEEKGLLYDLGDMLFQEGREEEAREAFRQLYESAPDYRDVAERIKMSGQTAIPESGEEEEPDSTPSDSGQSRVSYL